MRTKEWTKKTTGAWSTENTNPAARFQPAPPAPFSFVAVNLIVALVPSLIACLASSPVCTVDDHITGCRVDVYVARSVRMVRVCYARECVYSLLAHQEAPIAQLFGNPEHRGIGQFETRQAAAAPDMQVRLR